MKLHVLLYDTSKQERPNAFTITARSVADATRFIPDLLKRHLQRPHTRCTLNGWSISSYHAGTRLYRIVATGALTHDKPERERPGPDELATSDIPRDDND